MTKLSIFLCILKNISIWKESCFFFFFSQNRYSVYLTPINNTSCLQTKQRTEKASCKEETPINNLESKEEANNKEFIHFSRRKKMVLEEGRKMSEWAAWKAPWHWAGEQHKTSWAVPTTASDPVRPQAAQPRRKPLPLDTQFWFRFSF